MIESVPVIEKTNWKAPVRGSKTEIVIEQMQVDRQ